MIDALPALVLGLLLWWLMLLPPAEVIGLLLAVVDGVVLSLYVGLFALSDPLDEPLLLLLASQLVLLWLLCDSGR